MNLELLGKKDDLHFSKLINTSESVKIWLLNRLGGYNNIQGYVTTLHISIDTYTPVFKDEKTGIEYYSFNWCINSYEIDHRYGDKIKGGKHSTIITGGLVFRELKEVISSDFCGNDKSRIEPIYSSHT